MCASSEERIEEEGQAHLLRRGGVELGCQRNKKRSEKERKKRKGPWAKAKRRLRFLYSQKREGRKTTKRKRRAHLLCR
jgi:hypothetical protein